MKQTIEFPKLWARSAIFMPEEGVWCAAHLLAGMAHGAQVHVRARLPGFAPDLWRWLPLELPPLRATHGAG